MLSPLGLFCFIMSEKLEPSFYAVIPANVRYCKDITSSSKLLYGEITSLCHKEGYCWASNSYFAELYGVSTKTVSTWIKELITFGFISSQIIYKEGTNEIVNRYLRLCAYPTHEKVNTPTHKKVKDNNNKEINNKINNKKEEEKEKPTAADEIPDYIKANRDAIKPKPQITKEQLKADLLENEYCRRSANQNGVKANYEIFVDDFIFEKFGLGENTKWQDLSDARSHFARWVPYHKKPNSITAENGRKQQSNVIL